MNPKITPKSRKIRVLGEKACWMTHPYSDKSEIASGKTEPDFLLAKASFLIFFQDAQIGRLYDCYEVEMAAALAMTA